MSKHLTRKTVNELASGPPNSRFCSMKISRASPVGVPAERPDQLVRHEYDHVTEQQLSGALLLQGANGSEKPID